MALGNDPERAEIRTCVARSASNPTTPGLALAAWGHAGVATTATRLGTVAVKTAPPATVTAKRKKD